MKNDEAQKTQKVSTTEARFKMREFIEQVQKTQKPIIIQHWGRDVAQLGPIQLSEKADADKSKGE